MMGKYHPYLLGISGLLTKLLASLSRKFNENCHWLSECC